MIRCVPESVRVGVRELEKQYWQDQIASKFVGPQNLQQGLLHRRGAKQTGSSRLPENIKLKLSDMRPVGDLWHETEKVQV